MEFQFVEQNVQYHFSNENYENGTKVRSFKNVKQSATPEGLKAVGKALLPLTNGDALKDIMVIKRETIDITE